MRKPEIAFSPEALLHVLKDRLGLGDDAAFKVAYSGGLDSHVLLHALCRLREGRDGFRVGVVHIDHGLHAESSSWAEHCATVCRQLDVPCLIERIEINRNDREGLEGAARRLRYQRLAHHLALGEVLLTAHHRDDQAETVLLQLMRGAGIHGLAAMPEITDFPPGRLARPLLGFSRRDLEAYAGAQGLRWIDDSSNLDMRFARNFVRQRILPLLNERWPGAAGLLARGARHAAEAATLLDEIARTDMEACAEAGGGHNLSVPALLTLPAPRARNLLRYWLRSQGFPSPSTQQLGRIIDCILHPSRTAHALVAWPGVEVRRYRDVLSVTAPLPQPERDLDLPWQPGQPLDVPGTGYRLSAMDTDGQGLSRARLSAGPVHVRLRQGGETCRLPGRRHRHKLKKLLQEAGVPPWERLRLPLVYVGRELAAVGDRWVCEPFVAGAGERGMTLVLRKTSDAPWK